MSDYQNTKITIIGFGNLMQDIFPCIRDLVGEQNLHSNVNATTGDEAAVTDLENQYGIKVFYLSNLTALKTLQPDLIFFAPPPDLAPVIITNELKEYFAWLREQETALPEIYAYPPVPHGKAYQDVLGEDVRVVNIIPNDIRVIAGEPVKAERSITATLATFASPWPERSLQRFRDFFAPLGGVLELKPSELIPVLGGRVISNAQAELCLELEKLFKEYGYEIGFQQIAGYLRAVLQKETGYQPLGKSLLCSLDEIEGDPTGLLSEIILAWADGLSAYFTDLGFSQDWIRENQTPGMDLTLHKTQRETPQAIYEHTVIAATKGGVLERGLKYLREEVLPDLKEAVRLQSELPGENWREELTEKVRQGAHVVRKHGEKLSG